ncbi:MAG: GerAB/ArcD/ProY family transporter, partial [Clostridia bacterium]|nr:GerAB/ArcD/ProY family transporter [Clostridia bacterium]
PNTSALVISSIYILLALFLATRKKKVIYVLSLFAFIITAISFIVIFVLSAPHIDFDLLRQSFTLNVKSLTVETLFLAAYGIGQIIFAAVFIGKLPQKNKQQKVYMYGLIIGIALLLITALNIILVLGSDLISKVQYPYSAMTGIITLGNSFSRMDGITYLIYFITSLIKSAVILKVIIAVANKIGKNFGKIIKYITVILTIFIGASELFNKILHSQIVAIILLIFEATIFIALYIATFKKVKH